MSYLIDLALGSAIAKQLRSNPVSTLMLGGAAYFVWEGAKQGKREKQKEMALVATLLTVAGLSLRFVVAAKYPNNWLW